MDSTHKTNKHGWKLYTVLVCNSFSHCLVQRRGAGNYGVVGVAAKLCFHSAHNARTCLKVARRTSGIPSRPTRYDKRRTLLKQWARTSVPPCFIIELSSIEENAGSRTFPGLPAGN